MTYQPLACEVRPFNNCGTRFLPAANRAHRCGDSWRASSAGSTEPLLPSLLFCQGGTSDEASADRSDAVERGRHAGAAGLAETKVEVKGVHLCCPACVKGVGNALKGVDGVKGVCDNKAGTVTLTAADEATVQKGIDALAAAGFHGQLDTNKAVKYPSDSGATKGKVKSLTLEGIHNCCPVLQQCHQESRQEGRGRHWRYRQTEGRNLRGHRRLRGHRADPCPARSRIPCQGQEVRLRAERRRSERRGESFPDSCSPTSDLRSRLIPSRCSLPDGHEERIPKVEERRTCPWSHPATAGRCRSRVPSRRCGATTRLDRRTSPSPPCPPP